MTFFQNLFVKEFRGSLPCDDRQYNPSYVCPGNAGRGDEHVMAFAEPTYDMSGNDLDGDSADTLTLYYAIDPEFKGWAALSIDVADGAASSSAVTVDEIIANLEDNETFASLFAVSKSKFASGADRLVIRQKKPITNMRFYIANGRAEEVLKFNARAGVAELPSFFDHYTIANRWTYNLPDSILIKLTPGSSDVEAAIIDNATNARGVSLGYDSGSVQEDYQLLDGSNGYFMSKKITVDGSNRITQIIEYPTGADVGDFAKKTTYSYTGANTNPDKIVEVPYIMQSGDFVTP